MNKNTKLLLLVVGAIGIMFFWQPNQDQDTLGVAKTPTTELSYQDLSVSEFYSRSDISNTLVLDVHTPEQEHINSTDVFLPYNEIEDQQDKLPQDKDTEIVVYCRSGSMSQIASEKLVELGYTNVNNLVGGKKAYDEYIKQTQSKGEISVTPDSQDLGTVIYGDVSETTFVIENSTNQVINLTRVSTSCGCTKASTEKDVLQPGESTDMKVTFDPAVHGDATDLGELTRTIYVQTDHPDFAKFENTITANVVKSS